MQRLADYLGQMRQPAVAHRYGEFALELRAGISPQRLNAICKSTLESITAHPDGLLVIYVQAPDGSADNAETEKYKEIQSLARRHLWLSRLLWAFRGFRWWRRSSGRWQGFPARIRTFSSRSPISFI